jgi:hypothetical protein
MLTLVPEAMSQIRVTGVVYRELRGRPPFTPLALAYRRGETSIVVRNFISRPMAIIAGAPTPQPTARGRASSRR